MPTYNYKNVQSQEIFEFVQSIHDEVLTHHPITKEPIQKVVIYAPMIKTKGLFSNSHKVNKRSQAATACGCASNVALAKKMYSNSRTTPHYGTRESKQTVVSGIKTNITQHKHHQGNHSGHVHDKNCSH